VIENQPKAKNKITWKKEVSVPLGKGNDSTQPRQKQAQEKSTNHQSNARKPQRVRPAHTQAPPELMQFPLEECMQTSSQNRVAAPAQLWLVRPVHDTSQIGAQHVHRAWHLDQLDWWP
jgi:hypothetical protein